MKIKKGDNVIVRTGKDKGKSGKITRVLAKEDKVVISGVNMFKKHQRPKTSDAKGQVISVAMPIHASNVMIADPKDGKPTRIGKKKVGDKMVRIARRSNQEL